MGRKHVTWSWLGELFWVTTNLNRDKKLHARKKRRKTNRKPQHLTKSKGRNNTNANANTTKKV